MKRVEIDSKVIITFGKYKGLEAPEHKVYTAIGELEQHLNSLPPFVDKELKVKLHTRFHFRATLNNGG